MSFPRPLRLAPIVLLVAISGLWMSEPVALAQAPSPGRSAVEAPTDVAAKAAQPISLEDVPDRAETARAELDTLLPEDAPLQTLERIGSELDRTLPEVESTLAKTRKTLAAPPSIDQLAKPRDHVFYLFTDVGEYLHVRALDSFTKKRFLRSKRNKCRVTLPRNDGTRLRPIKTKEVVEVVMVHHHDPNHSLLSHGRLGLLNAVLSE